MSILRSIFGFGKKNEEGQNGLIDIDSKDSSGRLPELSAFSGKEGEIPRPVLPKFPESLSLISPIGSIPCPKTEEFSSEATILAGNCGVDNEGIELNAMYQTSDGSFQVTHALTFPFGEDQSPLYSNFAVLGLPMFQIVSRFDTTGVVMGRVISSINNIRAHLMAQIAGSEEERSAASLDIEYYGQDSCTAIKLQTPMSATMQFSQSIFRGVYAGILSHVDLSTGDSIFATSTRFQRKDNLSAFSLAASTSASPFNAAYICSLNPNLGLATLNSIAVNQRSGEIESETSWAVQASYMNAKWSSAIDTNFKLRGNYEETLSSSMKFTTSFQTDLFDRNDLKMGVKFEFGDSLEKVIKERDIGQF